MRGLCQQTVVSCKGRCTRVGVLDMMYECCSEVISRCRASSSCLNPTFREAHSQDEALSCSFVFSDAMAGGIFLVLRVDACIRGSTEAFCVGHSVHSLLSNSSTGVLLSAGGFQLPVYYGTLQVLQSFHTLKMIMFC